MSVVAEKRDYRICTRCIMDTSDPGISFDADGRCNRCRDFEFLQRVYVPNPTVRKAKLDALVSVIKEEGKNRDYDCVIGVSGGVDSTYVAYVVKQLGLRPLAIHLDNGWNSALAVSNIENCLKRLSIDLYTQVLDWDEFRDLQLAFLRASTPDSEVPTDHAIHACLVRKASELGIRYILSGANVATEGLVVPTWSSGHCDWKYIRSVHRIFGKGSLKSYPHLSLFDFAYFKYVRRQRKVYILDYVDYRKEEAVETIKRELGWQPYPGKHHESIYTRFFQSYILPRKFGYDKRRMHLSTLIMSGQMTREAALAEMDRDVCPPEQLREDRIYVAKKLGITERELDEIMSAPTRTIHDYPSYDKTLTMRVIKAVWQASRQRKADSAA